jgi:hypothetical protein
MSCVTHARSFRSQDVRYCSRSHVHWVQDLQIGPLEIPRVSFFTFADSPEGLSRTAAFDGLLTLGLFRRVFICHTHHYVVLDPR